MTDALAFLLRLLAGAVQFQRLPQIRRVAIVTALSDNGATALAECLRDSPQYTIGPDATTLERLTDT